MSKLSINYWKYFQGSMGPPYCGDQSLCTYDKLEVLQKAALLPKMDLFFEIQRKKSHIFCNVKDSDTVLDLKKIIEGIFLIAPENQLLKKAVDDQGKVWESIDDWKSLSDVGFSPANSKAQNPAIVALCFLKDGIPEEVEIEPLSTPPPLPDVMRPQESTTQVSGADGTAN